MQEQVAVMSETGVTNSRHAYRETGLSMKREDYQAAVSQRSSDLNAAMKRLSARVQAQGHKGRIVCREMLTEFQEKRQPAGRKFEQLKAASADTWQDFKREVAAPVASHADTLDTTAATIDSRGVIGRCRSPRAGQRG